MGSRVRALAPIRTARAIPIVPENLGLYLHELEVEAKKLAEQAGETAQHYADGNPQWAAAPSGISTRCTPSSERAPMRLRPASATNGERRGRAHTR